MALYSINLGRWGVKNLTISTLIKHELVSACVKKI